MKDVPNVIRQVEQINAMGVVPTAGGDRDPALGQTIYYQDTLLTLAEILALAGTNIEVVAAAPAGYAAVPTGVAMFLDYGSAAFVQTANTDQFALKYDSGSEIVEIGLAGTFEAFIEASADAYMNVDFGEAVSLGGMTPVAATAIDLDANGNDIASGGTASVIYIRVAYKLVPMSGAGFNNIAR